MFVTTNTLKRESLFKHAPYARIAVDSLYTTQERFPFSLYGFVIMPDHCHFLLAMPEHGSISRMMHHYKRAVSFQIGLGPMWQKRFDCRLVREGNAHSVLHYIYSNPVQAALCDDPIEYVWSSASGKWDILNINCFGEFE